MSGYRFDGRVAIVTGAGRGIGRAHALLLAERGAKVVVNDLGGTKEGFGEDPAPARDVVGEIAKAGGTAIADTNDVGTEAGCAALVARAVGEFGRIDVLVNNAGISAFAGPLDVDAANLERTLNVHVGGSFFATIAAWRHMVAQGYGRVVMTTSTGMFGLPDNLTYATAKGGVIGLARSLTVAGAQHGIKVNVLAPAASTRPSAKAATNSLAGMWGAPPWLDASLVSPMMAYLAHEDCPVSGEIYGAGAGRFTRLFIAETPGYVHEGEQGPSIEDVAGNWAQVNALDGFYIPTSLADWSSHFMAHHAQPSARQEARPGAPR
jgi:NAD(P)-dependent dehydrogenase (short-subunit alcohol dehydrogenase family)